MFFQRSVVLTALQFSEDLLSEVLGFPFVARRNQVINMGLTSSSAAGQFIDVIVSANDVAQNFQPSGANRFPVNPDDFVLGPFGMLSGDQLKLRVRETAGATPTLFIAIIDTPV
jgi:hypothetical protein